jgi:hypothetical protein
MTLLAQVLPNKPCLTTIHNPPTKPMIHNQESNYSSGHKR